MGKRIYYHLMMVAFLISIGMTINGQKIFPGAEGFGTESRGAYQGSASPTILIVDDLSPGSFSTGTNRGTFKWCVEQAFPRIVIFEVGGIIDYSLYEDNIINISNPYLSIYGQTAPSPGITLFGLELRFRNGMHDALIQHIKFRQDDKGPTGNVKCMVFGSSTSRLVADHCSFAYSNDEIFTIYNASSDFTLSNCIIAAPLNRSWHANESGQHEPEEHGMGIISHCEGNVTYLKNIIGYTKLRNPRTDNKREVFINNYVYSNSGQVGPQIVNSSPDLEYAIVGNEIVISEQYWSTQEYAAQINTSCSPLCKVYAEDNICKEGIDNPSNTDWQNIRNLIGAAEQSSSPVDLSGYSILPASEVEDYLRKYAGAFYWDRDIVDEFILNNLGKGEIVTINNADAIPARAYNFSGDYGYQTDAGNMQYGYNWAADPDIFYVNGKQLVLNVNCTNQQAVLNLLNSQLPSGVEAIDHPNPICYHIVLQTTETGSGASLTIANETGQDGSRVFGIYPGTYYGHDGYAGYPDSEQVTRSLSIPSNPHSDNNGNGFTNLEEWAAGFAGGNFRDISFHISDSKSGMAISDASVALMNYSTKATSASGEAIFTGIPEGSSFSYTISKSGYQSITGSVVADADKTLGLTLAPIVDDTPPTVPANLRSTGITPTSVSLAWNASTDNVGIQSYQVYRNGGLISTTGQLSLTDQGLSAATTFSYTVSAVDAAGNESSKSSTLQVTTLAAIDTEKPSPPGNLYAVATSSTEIELTWDEATDDDGIAGYRIYRDGELLGNTNQEGFADSGLNPDTEYTYAVYALDNSGNQSETAASISIRTTTDVKIVYIDPESTSFLAPDGSISAPFTNWSEIVWQEGYTYLQRRGTVMNEDKILITANNVSIGAYGTGNKPLLISSADDYALCAYEKSNISISDFEIAANNVIGGIYFAGSETDSIIVERCKITGGTYGIRIIGGNNYTIRYNEFRDNDNAVFTMAENTYLVYNQFSNNMTSIEVNNYTSKIKAFNNVFYDNYQAISSTYGGLELYNNIFSLHMPGSVAISQDLDEMISDYNIFYPVSGSGDFIHIADKSYSSLQKYQDEKQTDLHSMDLDPSFQDPVDGDFSLKDESPGINTGIDLGLSRDLKGNVVPVGPNPDIGNAESLVTTINDLKRYNSKYQVEIYPNPNDGRFNLSLDFGNSAPTMINIFSQKGELVYSVESKAHRNLNFNLEHLKKGSYFIKATNMDNMVVQKLIIIG
ncbi:MAG: T9SS type A sorting domain-containing protein [Bacteroidales bacterium]|nr:T9SS type A sorting domain-containing protein [Bacteroidales bacterium]